MRLLFPLLLFQATLHPCIVAASHAAGIVPNQYQTSTTSTTKNFTGNNGHVYAYDFAPARNASKPTFLFFHGYPGSRHDWKIQIETLTSEGFGVVAPDMLGFGDSSKPIAVEEYRLKALSSQIIEILDHEGLQEVIGVGHDWGTGMLSSVVTWYPKRFAKLAFVVTPYSPAGIVWDIDGSNKMNLQKVGFEPYGYWYFCNSWDAADVIERHLESYFHGFYATNASGWGINFADLAATRAWLNANTTTPLPAWLPASYKADWLRIYSQPKTVAATLNYYKALMRGVQAADEASLTDADRALRVPVLAVGATKDVVFLPEQQRLSTERWAKAGFEQKVLDCGHWAALERGEELAAILVDFGSK